MTMVDDRPIPGVYRVAAIAATLAVLLGCAMLARPPEGLDSVVYRIRFNPQGPASIAEPGVVVSGTVPADAGGAEQAYRAASGVAAPDLGGRSNAVILAAGPTLDGPDQVVAAPGEWHGRRFEVELRHTSASLSGKSLLRNVPWRPLAAISLNGIPAGGVCEVVVRWQPVDSLPDGKALSQPLVTTASFRVD